MDNVSESSASIKCALCKANCMSCLYTNTTSVVFCLAFCSVLSKEINSETEIIFYFLNYVCNWRNQVAVVIDCTLSVGYFSKVCFLFFFSINRAWYFWSSPFNPWKPKQEFVMCNMLHHDKHVFCMLQLTGLGRVSCENGNAGLCFLLLEISLRMLYFLPLHL